MVHYERRSESYIQTDRLQEVAVGGSSLRRASDHVISADDARAIMSNGPRGLRWTGLLQRRLVSLLHAACSPQTRRVDGGAAWIYPNPNPRRPCAAWRCVAWRGYTAPGGAAARLIARL